MKIENHSITFGVSIWYLNASITLLSNSANEVCQYTNKKKLFMLKANTYVHFVHKGNNMYLLWYDKRLQQEKMVLHGHPFYLNTLYFLTLSLTSFLSQRYLSHGYNLNRDIYLLSSF